MSRSAAVPQRRAVFRCDASPAIGGGHVMRCLSLARALREQGWSCLFAVSAETPSTLPRLTSLSDGLLVLKQSAGEEPGAIAAWLDGPADLLVVDHYRRDIAFERACRSWAQSILVIDDMANRAHDADVLVDPTCGRNVWDYDSLVPRHCRVLAGSDYALLRPDFAVVRPGTLERRRDTIEMKRILVAFGAGDVAEATRLALHAIATSGLDASVDVVMGAASTGLATVRAALQAMPQAARLHVDTDKLAALMADADLAIGAGGGLSWERCCLGLPTVVLETAANQRGVIAALAERRAVLALGACGAVAVERLADALRELAAEPRLRRNMAGAAADLCDGQGVARVLRALRLPHKPARAGVRLRPAALIDVERIFRWQIHASTRLHSFNPAPPTWEEHVRWLWARLVDPSCRLCVILMDDRPAGTIRLDRRQRPAWGEVAEISIALDPDVRGQGIGTAALAEARRLAPEAALIARVKAKNEASRRLFIGSGYQPMGPGVLVQWPLAAQPRATAGFVVGRAA